jgi:hypothetical protein
VPKDLEALAPSDSGVERAMGDVVLVGVGDDEFLTGRCAASRTFSTSDGPPPGWPGGDGRLCPHGSGLRHHRPNGFAALLVATG